MSTPARPEPAGPTDPTDPTDPTMPTQRLPDGHYTVAAERCIVRFRAKAFGLLWVRGQLPVAAGTFEVRADRVHGAGELAADAIDTGLGPRDWHLRSSHYLRTADHPRIRVRTDAGTLNAPQLTCNVTVRGVEPPVALAVEGVEHEGASVRITLRTALDRSPYPMLPPLAGVSRVVHLEVDLVATPAH